MTRQEVQHLIDLIVSEMATAIGRPQVRCQCHSVLDDCCPDRLRGVLDAGATRVGVHAIGGAPEAVAMMIDHTLLKPDATRQQIEELCREAAQRSEEHTSELQSQSNLVCRLLLEKKKNNYNDDCKAST